MGQGFLGGFPPAALATPAAVENSMVALPRRHRLFLPLWKTQWGLSPGGTGYPCRCGARGGLAFFGCLSPLPLALFLPPIPPTRARRALFPGGEGGDQGYFMQGASPLASPAFDRLRHLQTLPCRYPGIKPLAAQAEPEKQAPGRGLPPWRCRLTLSCRCPAAEAGRRWDGASPAPGGGLPPGVVG